MTTTLDIDPAITEFASAVRGALLDLGPEEVDDLTEGLEADLIDQVADSGTESLGDPVAYAEELRSAAGLPVRVASRTALWPQVKANLQAARDYVAGNRVLSAMAAFLLALRPAWWVLRAWVIYALFNIAQYGPPMAIPTSALGYLALAAMVVVSVQWGRGRWIPWPWVKVVVVGASVVAVLAIPGVIDGTVNTVRNYLYDQAWRDAGQQQGLLLNGSSVSNIFAYDEHGDPLTNVQLFDQSGKPLSIVSDSGQPTYYNGETDSVLVPSEGVAGRLGWNVYPLESVDYTALNPESGEPTSWAKRSPAVPPAATVQPLLGAEKPETPETTDEAK